MASLAHAQCLDMRSTHPFRQSTVVANGAHAYYLAVVNLRSGPPEGVAMTLRAVVCGWDVWRHGGLANSDAGIVTIETGADYPDPRGMTHLVRCNGPLNYRVTGFTHVRGIDVLLALARRGRTVVA